MEDKIIRVSPTLPSSGSPLVSFPLYKQQQQVGMGGGSGHREWVEGLGTGNGWRVWAQGMGGGSGHKPISLFAIPTPQKGQGTPNKALAYCESTLLLHVPSCTNTIVGCISYTLHTLVY